jgi:hypothetical protein
MTTPAVKSNTPIQPLAGTLSFLALLSKNEKEAYQTTILSVCTLK